jgi:hypothetical protein
MKKTKKTITLQLSVGLKAIVVTSLMLNGK